MYTTVRGIPSVDSGSEPVGPPESAPDAATTRRRRVSSLVVTLGTVSFFTDLSSEMVVAVLPVYLTLVLGLTPLQYGIIDGLYQGVTAAVRIVGGIAADLTRRPKVVALIGYGLSCVTKLLFLPAHSFAAITGLVALDRSGKGVRTAPRDAMIADASEPSSLGYSFGVHRAMDTAGALGGPLIAFGVLALLVDAYRTIFVLSFSLAAVGVAVLVLFVPGGRRRVDEENAEPDAVMAPGSPAAAAPVRAEPVVRKGALRRTLREFAGLARHSGYRRLLAVGALLSLATISDGFVYLTLKERVGIAPTWFPLLFVGTAAGYLVLAVPFGRLADRVGRVRVFIGGHVLAAIAYVCLWLLPPGPWLIVVVLALVGSYYAATDGVLPALTAPMVPLAVRTSGIAGVQTVMAIGSMASAALFGAFWAGAGRQAAVGWFSVGLVAAVSAAAFLLSRVDGWATSEAGA